jgi:SnoaL-like polyketide cyclase
MMFMSAEEIMNLMKTLDDAWNLQDWDTFSKRHANDVIVSWPGQPPTVGIEAHKKEGEYFFKALP